MIAGCGAMLSAYRMTVGAVLYAGLLVSLCAVVWAVTWHWHYSRPRYLLWACAVAALATYLTLMPGVIEKVEKERAETERLTRLYPFEPVNDRLPPLPSGSSPAFDGADLDCLEEKITDYGFNVSHDRRAGLAHLHTKAVANFVNAWGFGFERMPPRTEDGLNEFLRTEPAPWQPSRDSAAPPPALDWGRDSLGLRTLHRDGVIDFVHLYGFGFVKDRGHVAGFQSHRFSEMPAPRATSERVGDRWVSAKLEWQVARLELVSLLLHKEPGVYVSDRLPQMDALKGVPTRPLDEFEADGLARLRGGEQLIVRGNRMLGAVRNAKQCISCHGGDRGALLGAFTYTLRPAK